jgi:hypothetical protein
MEALSNTVVADVSRVQVHLRAAEVMRAELAPRFGEPLASQLIDRALSHEAVQKSRMPLADLRALIAGELLNRVGELLVATAEMAIAEQEQRAATVEQDAIREITGTRETDVGRPTAPDTPAAIDRSEVRRALP